jgi:hypothetical protein
MPMKKGMDMARSKASASGLKGLDRAAEVHARNAERKAAHGKMGVGNGKGKGLVNRGKRGA